MIYNEECYLFLFYCRLLFFFEKRGGRIVERFFDEDIIFLMVVGLYCLMFFNYYIYNNVNVNFCVRCVFGGIMLSFCGIGIS